MEKIKFKGKGISTHGLVKRILYYHGIANPENLEQGMSWYNRAHEFCKELGEELNLPLFHVAGVVAALSPLVEWSVNKQNARDFLQGTRVSVHTKSQIAKAHACLHTEYPEEIFNLLTIKGTKTSWFFWNILYPDTASGVTIDRHAIGSCVFSPSNAAVIPDNYSHITINQYNFFMRVYMRAAEIRGILPHQMQAIVWEVYKSIRSKTNDVLPETETPF